MKNFQQTGQVISNTGSNQSQEALDQTRIKAPSILHLKVGIFYLLLKKYSIDAIAFVSCIFLGWVVSSHLLQENPNENSGGLASAQILLNKGLRGIYPSLGGETSGLFFTWKIELITALDKSDATYDAYKIVFKNNQILELRKTDCNGNIKFKWGSFYHNIYIREIKNSQEDMVIPNEQEDIDCISGDGAIIVLLQNISIWTINEGKLYLLSEIFKEKQMNTFMLIFQKQLKTF